MSRQDDEEKAREYLREAKVSVQASEDVDIFDRVAYATQAQAYAIMALVHATLARDEVIE